MGVGLHFGKDAAFAASSSIKRRVHRRQMALIVLKSWGRRDAGIRAGIILQRFEVPWTAKRSLGLCRGPAMVLLIFKGLARNDFC